MSGAMLMPSSISSVEETPCVVPMPRMKNEALVPLARKMEIAGHVEERVLSCSRCVARLERWPHPYRQRWLIRLAGLPGCPWAASPPR